MRPAFCRPSSRRASRSSPRAPCRCACTSTTHIRSTGQGPALVGDIVAAAGFWRDEVARLGRELNEAKCTALASHPDIRTQLELGLQVLGIKVAKQAVDLGVDFGLGAVRGAGKRRPESRLTIRHHKMTKVKGGRDRKARLAIVTGFVAGAYGHVITGLSLAEAERVRTLVARFSGLTVGRRTTLTEQFQMLTCRSRVDPAILLPAQTILHWCKEAWAFTKGNNESHCTAI